MKFSQELTGQSMKSHTSDQGTAMETTHTETSEDEGFQYHHFDTAKERNDVYVFTKQTVEYLESLSEPSVVFLDRAARPAWVAIDEFWNQKHPNDNLPKPKFYFLNPEGFNRTRGEWRLSPKDRTDDVVVKELQEKAKVMLQDKDKPLVVIDTCIHTGSSMESVFFMLKKVGFKDIRTIIANTDDNHSDFESAIRFKKNSDGCSIFSSDVGHDEPLNKYSDSIFTALKNSTDARKDSAEIRKEIRQIIKDRFEK